MRAGAPNEVIAGAAMYGSRISSWLGGRLLAATIPIVSGRATGDVTDDVLHKVTLSIPRFAAPTEGADVIDWRPGSDPEAPLARFGQELDVTVIVTSVITGQTFETRVGRYVIQDWDDDDDGMLSVKASGVLSRPKADKIGSPVSPSGSLMSEARRIAPAGIGVRFDPALVDRACPRSMSWSDDRYAALSEIADAWPALLRSDEWGQIVFAAPLPPVPVPVLTLKDGADGTLISAPRADSRDGAWNEVIATSSNTDAPDVQGIAQVTSGPMSVNGPYGHVTRKWSSPLLSTADQAAAAARTMLANSVRPAQSIPARVAPDPRIDLDDAVALQRGSDRPVWGWITKYDLPLTADGGDMRVDVGVPV